MDGEIKMLSPHVEPVEADKPKRKGAFSSESGKAARARVGKADKGISREARKHAKWVIKSLRHDAEHSRSETAKSRAKEMLLKYAVGTAPTAEQMGAVEPLDGGQNSVAQRWGHDDNPGLMALLERMEAEGADHKALEEAAKGADYSLLTDVELAAFRYLVRKARKEDVKHPEAVILRRQQHDHQQLEEPYVSIDGRLVGVIPGCLPLPTGEPETPDPTRDLKDAMQDAPSSAPTAVANVASAKPQRAPAPSLSTTRPPGTAMADLEWSPLPGNGTGRRW